MNLILSTTVLCVIRITLITLRIFANKTENLSFLTTRSLSIDVFPCDTKAMSWLIASPKELIDRYAIESVNFNLALRMYEAMRPTLMKESQIYLSDVGDIEMFLLLSIIESDILVSIVKSEEQEFVETAVVKGIEGQQLVAAFLVSHPNAIVSCDGGIPVYLLVPDTTFKKHLTFTNLLAAVKSGATNFVIAVAGAPGSSGSSGSSGLKT
jgi:hypothetical protein